MILFIILNLCLAAGFTFGKAALSYMNPILFIGVRMTIAGTFLVGYQFLVKKEQLLIKFKDLPLFIGLCTLHIYASFIFEYWALQYISASKACLLFNLSPFVTAFFAYIWSYEIMTPYKWLGLTIGFLGMLPIVVETNPEENMSGMIGYLSYAELVLFGSIVCAALGWIFMRKLINNHNYSPITLNGLSMFIGGVMALITSLLVEGEPHLLVQQQPDSFFGSPLMAALFYIFLLILLCNIISYNIYGFLLRSYSATFLSFTGFMTPLFTALLTALVFGGTPSIWFFLSVFLVGYGLYIFYREESRLEESVTL